MTFFMSVEAFENFLSSSNDQELIAYLMVNNFLRKERFCCSCGSQMRLAKFKKVKDGVAWRCHHRQCSKSKDYFSVKEGSFFESIGIPMRRVMKILLKYSVRQPLYSILGSIDCSRKTLQGIIDMFRSRINCPNFSSNKLRGTRKGRPSR